MTEKRDDMVTDLCDSAHDLAQLARPTAKKQSHVANISDKGQLLLRKLFISVEDALVSGGNPEERIDSLTHMATCDEAKRENPGYYRDQEPSQSFGRYTSGTVQRKDSPLPNHVTKRSERTLAVTAAKNPHRALENTHRGPYRGIVFLCLTRRRSEVREPWLLPRPRTLTSILSTTSNSAIPMYILWHNNRRSSHRHILAAWISYQGCYAATAGCLTCKWRLQTDYIGKHRIRLPFVRVHKRC